MKKIILYTYIIFNLLFLFSCKEENGKTVYVEPTYEDIMIIDDLNYIEDIKEVRIYPMVGYDEYIKYVTVTDIADFYNIIKDISMNKYYRVIDEKYSLEYRNVLKDINEYLCININDKNENLDFYIGISGYLYYFKDDFYYQSSDNIYYDLIVDNTNINIFNTIINIGKLTNESNVEILNDNISVSLDNSKKTEFIAYLKKIELCLLGNPVNGNSSKEVNYINEKSKNGIEIKLGNVVIKVSTDGSLYVIVDNVYTTPSIDKNNYYELFINYFNGQVELVNSENYFSNEVKLFDLIDTNNITMIRAFYIDGYVNAKTFNSTETMNSIYSAYSDITMNRYDKYDNDGNYYSQYHYALNDVYEEMRFVFYNEIEDDWFYVGSSGYIYYFLDDCYYKSSSSCQSITDEIIGVNIRTAERNCRLFYSHLHSTILENDTLVSIEVKDDNGLTLYEFKDATELEEILSILEKIELYYIAGSTDYMSSGITYSDKLIYYNNIPMKLTLKFEYKSGRGFLVCISEDGRFYMGGSTMYASTIHDENDYYWIIMDLIDKNNNDVES